MVKLFNKLQVMTALKIATHSGTFHCDEILACYMLKKLDKYKHAEIVRTRDKNVISQCDIVVDVGGVFDPTKNLFDHHQNSFKETMNSINPKFHWKIKLSSAGLIYAHFGEVVIKSIIGEDIEKDKLKHIFNSIYQNFIQEIDGIDNGVEMFTNGEPSYTISTDLSSRVSHFNPSWNSENEDITSCFYEAMKLVGTEFENKIKYYNQVSWPAYKIVKDAIESRYSIHNSGEIMELPHFCPWKNHYFEIKQETDFNPSVKFVVFPGDNGTFRVQAVPFSPKSFTGPVFLKQEWRGFTDLELSKLADIEGCIFVHSTGFIGANKTRDGALKMAIKSLIFSE